MYATGNEELYRTFGLQVQSIFPNIYHVAERTEEDMKSD